MCGGEGGIFVCDIKIEAMVEIISLVFEGHPADKYLLAGSLCNWRNGYLYVCQAGLNVGSIFL